MWRVRLRLFDHGGARSETHPADQRIGADECRDLRRIVDQRVGVELRCLIEELLASVENDVLSFSRYSDSLPHTGSRETATLQCVGSTRVGTALSGSGFYVIRNIAKHIATMTNVTTVKMSFL
jgi:hypothetical protein